jgi:hypothetical protein
MESVVPQSAHFLMLLRSCFWCCDVPVSYAMATIATISLALIVSDTQGIEAEWSLLLCDEDGQIPH